MDEPSPDRIELGSSALPDVLRSLAGVLPQFEGADLEGQLQSFDVFLGILAPSVRPEVARLLTGAASQAKSPAARARIEAAAASVAQGGRAAEPYDHTKAMQAYQESFQKDNPAPVPASAEESPAPEKDAPAQDPAGSFRETIKRRAIVMEIGGFRPPENPRTSWFGKVAFGLPGETWPGSEEGLPLAPLAQINLTELPFRPPPLDDIEFLAVFIDPDNYNDDDPNESSWCVRAYPSLARLVPLNAPDEIDSEIKALPLRPKIIEEDYPVHDDIAGAIPDDVSDSYADEFENVSGFKLGGWPTLIQGTIDWNSGMRESAQPAFVFQIDSTEKGRWSWGDGGVGYIGRGTSPGHQNEWFFTWQCY